MTTKTSTYATSGWVFFAATVLFVVGAMNIIYGLVLLFNDTYAVLVEEGLLVFDFTTWGWVLLILGLLQLATGAGALAGQTWARVVGVIMAALSALSMLPVLGVYALWGLVILSIDIIIIYALAAKGGEVEMM